MADYAQSPYAGIRYSRSRRSSASRRLEFARLYTAPGVDHVGSGAPANVDMLSVLVDWVENGKAPGDLEVTEQKVEVPNSRRCAHCRCASGRPGRITSRDLPMPLEFRLRAVATGTGRPER